MQYDTSIKIGFQLKIRLVLSSFLKSSLGEKKFFKNLILRILMNSRDSFENLVHF